MDLSKDKYNYKGWLNSEHFLKRCFAVFGYYTVASLIISGVLLTVVLIFVLLIASIAAVAFI